MDLHFGAAVATIVGTLLAVFFAIKKLISWFHQRNIYRVEDTEVTLSWLEQTPLKQKWEEQGYKLSWPLLKELEIKGLHQQRGHSRHEHNTLTLNL